MWKLLTLWNEINLQKTVAQIKTLVSNPFHKEDVFKNEQLQRPHDD